jgi:hypothetical protein
MLSKLLPSFVMGSKGTCPLHAECMHASGSCMHDQVEFSSLVSDLVGIGTRRDPGDLDTALREDF